jgi:hypothetical protein
MQNCQFRTPSTGDGMPNSLGTWSLCVVAALRMLQEPTCTVKLDELHRYLARAERRGQISEFCALCLQALLAMSEESEFSIDYLEMTEAIASSSHQRAIAADTRIAHDWLQANQVRGIRSVQTLLVHDCQAVDLWDNLVSALCGLGETETSACRKLVDSIAA